MISLAHAAPASPRHRPPEGPGVASRIARGCRGDWRAASSPSPAWHHHPALNLGGRQVEGPARLRHGRLALDDLDDERRPPFDVVVHRLTHGYVLHCSMSRISLGRYNDGLGCEVISIS